MSVDSPAGWEQTRSFHHSRYDEAFLAARERLVSAMIADTSGASVAPRRT